MSYICWSRLLQKFFKKYWKFFLEFLFENLNNLDTRNDGFRILKRIRLPSASLNIQSYQRKFYRHRDHPFRTSEIRNLEGEMINFIETCRQRWGKKSHKICGRPKWMVPVTTFFLSLIFFNFSTLIEFCS